MSEFQLPQPFDNFRDSLNSIREGGEQKLGQGVDCTVWKVSVDGIDYAIKVANPLSIYGRERNISPLIQWKIRSGIQALGINGLEQIVSGDPESGVVVFELVDGICLSTVKTADEIQYTDSQVAELFESIEEANARLIQFDGGNLSGNNAFFSPENGFTLIDYCLVESDKYLYRNKKSAISSLGVVGVELALNYGTPGWN